MTREAITVSPSAPKLTGVAIASLVAAAVVMWVGVALSRVYADMQAVILASSVVLSMLFLVLGFWASLERLIRWRPVLRVDASGIDVQVIVSGLRHFDWDDMAALVSYSQPLQMFTGPPQRFIGIKLRDPLGFRVQLGPVARLLVSKNRVADIWISSLVFPGSVETLLAAIEHDYAREIRSHDIAIHRIKVCWPFGSSRRVSAT